MVRTSSIWASRLLDPGKSSFVDPTVSTNLLFSSVHFSSFKIKPSLGPASKILPRVQFSV